MTGAGFTQAQFVLFLLFGGLTALICIIIPVQLAAKLRRIRRAYTHRTCRICGYRFLRRSGKEALICPHCGAQN